MVIRRGDIFYADLRPVIGSEQGGVRPVLIIQNDVGNRHSPTVICAAITSQMNKAKLPTHRDFALKNKNPCSACEFQAKQGISIWGIKLLFFSV